MSNVRDYLNKVSPMSAEGYKQNVPSTGRQVDYLTKEAKVFKPRMDQEERIRFFPGLGGYFAMEIPVHFNVGPEKRTVMCMAYQNEACPICAEVRRLYDLDKPKEAGPLKQTSYWLTYVLDRNKEELGPQIFPLSNSAIDRLRDLLRDREDNSLIQFDDVESGNDVFLIRKEDGRGKRFAPITFTQLCKPSGITKEDKRLPAKFDANKHDPASYLTKRTLGYFDYIYDTHAIERLLKLQTAEELMEIYGTGGGTRDDEEDQPVRRIRDDEDDNLRSATGPVRRKQVEEDVKDDPSDSSPEETAAEQTVDDEVKQEPVKETAAKGGNHDELKAKLAAWKSR